MDFTYRRAGTRGFDETVSAVEREIRSHGFGVSRQHDLKATLASKGFEIHPMRIFEVTFPDARNFGSEVCKIHVYAEEQAVFVAAITPWVLWEEERDTDDAAIAAAEASVIALVDAAVS